MFSPSCSRNLEDTNILVNPVNNAGFLNSLETCRGVLTSGGFETCAEAMYLRKKLMVLPIQNQYEQLCNAAALQQMGISVVSKVTEEFSNRLEEWLHTANVRKLTDITDTENLLNIIMKYAGRKNSPTQPVYESF
ncbi:MAG TPA: glycosyltransferase family protein [Balneolaceae bacterium]|nr:glycosyltransferase family protein [Balneolaceae bacterium]